MFGIKEYIKKQVKTEVSNYFESLTPEIKKEQFAKYVRNKDNLSGKITAWETMKLYTVKPEIYIEYLDESNHRRNFDINTKTIQGLKSVVNDDPKKYLQDDVKSIVAVKLKLWYKYKGSTDLSVQHFMNSLDNKVYSTDVLNDIFGEIDKFLIKNPELLL